MIVKQSRVQCDRRKVGQRLGSRGFVRGVYLTVRLENEKTLLAKKDRNCFALGLMNNDQMLIEMMRALTIRIEAVNSAGDLSILHESESGECFVQYKGKTYKTKNSLGFAMEIAIERPHKIAYNLLFTFKTYTVSARHLAYFPWSP